MKNITKEFLQSLFKRAEQEKEYVKFRYEEATSLTFPDDDTYYDISNSTITQKDGSKAIFDDITVEVSETLANQMELSLTKNGMYWSKFSLMDSIQDIDKAKVAEDKTKEIFSYINKSNFQKNISYVYKDLIIGTSIVKLFTVNKNGEKGPAYKHLNLGRCYILENGLGEVDTTFYKIKGFTIEKIYSMLGKSISEMTSYEKDKFYNEEGLADEIDIIECAVPLGNGKWEFFIYDEAFEHEFYSTKLDYNPYIVVRFNKKNDVSAWGIGKAVERLSLLKSIQYYSKVMMDVVSNDANPPYIIKSNLQKVPNVTFKPNSVTWLPQQVEIQPLFTNINVGQIAQLLAELKEQLKQAFLIDAILEAQARNTYKTASEIQLANTKFLDKFATYASSISEELTKELFIRTYKLLVSEKIIKPLPNDMSTEVSHTNPIVLGEKSKNVDKVVQLSQIAIGLMGQEGFVKEMDLAKVIPFLLHGLDAPMDIFKTEEDKQGEKDKAKIEQYDQMMSGGASGGGNGQMNAENLGEQMGGGLGQ